MRNAECGMWNLGASVMRFDAPRSIPHSAFPISHYKSIASGFSSICLSVCKNFAPVAPSITRWSQLIVTRMRRRDTMRSPPPSGTACGGIDHRREVLDVEHAEVRDAERRAGVLLGLEPTIARAAGKLARFGADLTQALQVGVSDHRRDQSILDRHRHPDVDLVPVPDVILLEPGVAGAMLHEREGDGFDDDVVERDFPAFFTELLVERLASFRGALHVDLGREEEMRYGAERCRETLRDRLADLSEGDVLVGDTRASCVVRRAWCRCRCRRGPFDIALDHATTRPGTLHELQVDARVSGDSSRER